MLGQRRDSSRFREGPGSTDIPKTFPSDQRVDPNPVALHCLALPESGAGDGNRTHGSSLGSLGITIIRRPHRAPILVALRKARQMAIQVGEREAPPALVGDITRS